MKDVCMFDQMCGFFNNILSKYQCSFHQGYNTQYCPLAMTEKSKEVLDKEGFCKALKRDFHITKLAVDWLNLSH